MCLSGQISSLLSSNGFVIICVVRTVSYAHSIFDSPAEVSGNYAFDIWSYPGFWANQELLLN